MRKTISTFAVSQLCSNLILLESFAIVQVNPFNSSNGQIEYKTLISPLKTMHVNCLQATRDYPFISFTLQIRSYMERLLHAHKDATAVI